MSHDFDELTKSDLLARYVELISLQGFQSTLVQCLFRQLATLSLDAAGQALADFSSECDDQLEAAEAAGLDETTLERFEQQIDDLFEPLFHQLGELEEKTHSSVH